MEEGHPWQGVDDEGASRVAGRSVGRRGEGSELFPCSGSAGLSSRAFSSPKDDP